MFPVINFFGFPVATYGLGILVAALLTFLLVGISAKKKNVDFICTFLIWLVGLFGALLGAKILYIFVTYPVGVLVDMLCSGNFSFITSGGYVFYGGLFGGIIGAFIGGKLAMTKLSYVEDCIVPFIPLAHAIGRVGCFFAGCCYGIPYDGFLAVPYGKLIKGHAPDETIFPVQLLEAFLDVVICVVLLHIAKKKLKKFDLVFIYLALYGIMRFVTEFFRGDIHRGLFLGVSTSQWISLGIVVVCVARFLLDKWGFFEKNQKSEKNS